MLEEITHLIFRDLEGEGRKSVCLAIQGRARKKRIGNQCVLQFRKGLEKRG